MTSGNKDAQSDSTLETVEKWRNLQLERARLEHSERQRVVADRQESVDEVQASIDESQALARNQAQDAQLISPDTLTRIQAFTALQMRELERAADALKQSETQAAAAFAEVQNKFRALNVVEKLRERRAADNAREASRRSQANLDDQALTRGARTIDINKKRD